jgi:hypothetical protein
MLPKLWTIGRHKLLPDESKRASLKHNVLFPSCNAHGKSMDINGSFARNIQESVGLFKMIITRRFLAVE